MFVNVFILILVNYSVINVIWKIFFKLNGLIICYNVSCIVNSIFKVYLNFNDEGFSMNFVIGGLKFFMNYIFEVIVCMIIGCKVSLWVFILILEVLLEGVYLLNFIVIGVRGIEVMWIELDVLNGVIVKYLFYRGNFFVYNGIDVCYKNSKGKDVCVFEDKDNGL